jgi:hypothetical protein
LIILDVLFEIGTRIRPTYEVPREPAAVITPNPPLSRTPSHRGVFIHPYRRTVLYLSHNNNNLEKKIVSNRIGFGQRLLYGGFGGVLVPEA